MAVVGDLVAYLSMDSSKFAAGAQRAQTVATQMNASMSKAMSPQIFQQAGFALQDFMSILSMGGPNAAARAFGGVANNVQMLGAAFGPIGMAITSVGGALAGILLPALLRTEEQTDTLTMRMRDFESALNARLAGLQAAADREQKINDLVRDGNAQRIAREQDNLEIERRLIEAKVQVREDAFRNQLLRENVLAEQAGKELPARAFMREAGRDREIPLASAFQASGALKAGATVRIEGQIYDALRGQSEELDKLRQQREENLRMAEALRGVEGKRVEEAIGPEERMARVRQQAADAQKRQWEEQNRQFAEGLRMREQMWERTRTPAEKYRLEVQRITDAFRSGIIDEEIATRALQQLRGPAPQIKATQEAATEGSAAAISAITKAVTARDVQADQLSLQKAQLEEAKEMLRRLTSIDNKLDIQAVEITQ